MKSIPSFQLPSPKANHRNAGLVDASRSWILAGGSFHVCVAVLVFSAALQAQQPPPRARQAFTSTATAILVDVVVRDKNGRPVTDLSAPDFQIFEEGIPQKVESFTRVSHGGGIGVGVSWRAPDRTVSVKTEHAAAAVSEPDAPPEEATTALVFDHLSAESLRLAQKATLDYVPLTGDSSVRVGVFATDPGVRVVQPYTTDRAAVRRAVTDIVAADESYQEQTAERSDELMERRKALQGGTGGADGASVTGFGAALASNAADVGQRQNELKLIQTELNMIRSFDNFERSNKGYDTSLALLGVVQSLAAYPGRKTIVLFSEGLPVTPSLSAKLDFVIDAANRANVTAYAVDAKGLRTNSTLTATRKEMQNFVDDRLAQNGTGSDRTEQPLTMAFERVEDTLKLDSRSGLARLANDTGGFLVEQSNNLTAAFQRIDEDNQFHYLLTYAPRNDVFDGKFRAIHVKVDRPGAQVFARKGYRALRAGRTIDAGSFELPALAMLDRTPLPNAFPVHAGGFSFPDPARPGLTPVLVHVSTDSLRFNIDRQRSTYSAQAAIVVRIRDAKGREAQTISQQYMLSGDAKDLDAARKGDILFYREPELPPGVYTMEAIVFDATAQQGSAREATISVPAASASPFGVSSLLIVNRAEELKDRPAAPGPLFVGRTLLYPNVGEPIRKSAGAELPFYFTVYGNVQGVTASAQLLKNGAVVAEAPIQLSAPNGAQIQQVGRIPIAGLPPGTYELHISVANGLRQLSRSAFFTLQE
jgi:VWFA-related protein